MRSGRVAHPGASPALEPANRGLVSSIAVRVANPLRHVAFVPADRARPQRDTARKGALHLPPPDRAFGHPGPYEHLRKPQQPVPHPRQRRCRLGVDLHNRAHSSPSVSRMATFTCPLQGLFIRSLRRTIPQSAQISIPYLVAQECDLSPAPAVSEHPTVIDPTAWYQARGGADG
jgi:hypothetical protein